MEHARAHALGGRGDVLPGACANVESDGRVRRPDVGRTASFRRRRHLFDLRLRAASWRSPVPRYSARRRHGGAGGADDFGSHFPYARRLFRHRHLGAGRGLPHRLFQRFRARRRLRAEPHGDGPDRPLDARDRRLSDRRDHPHRRFGRDQSFATLALRPRPHGDPRQRGRGREPGRRR